MRRLFPFLLLAAAGDPATEARPWPKGGGNPAVVFFIGSHADDPAAGTNAAFHVGGGLFLTCVHAFESYEEFGILTTAGTRARVDRIAAYDRSIDVAAFTVDPLPEGLAALELSAAVPARGEAATLCGFPENLYAEQSLPVLGRWAVEGWGGLLMLEGLAAAGNSGGPVLDGKGRVEGMLFRSAFGGAPGDGAGPLTHAVAADTLARLAGAARAALKAGPGPGGPLPVEEWVRTGRDTGALLPHLVHRAEWRKEYGTAEEAIRKRLSAHPKEARTWALYAELFRRRGDLDSAAKAVDSALEAEPGDCRANFELGEIRQARGETASALAAYERCARARRPGMDFNDLILVSDAFCKQAYLLDGAGRGEEAVRAYRETLALCPYLSAERWRLGDLLCMLERPKEAIEAYGGSLDLFPRQPVVMLRRSIAASTAGDGKAALEDARRAAALDGRSAPALFLLGYFAWKEGRTEEARAQVGPLGDLDRGLADRLADHLAGRESRPPSFAYSIDGGLRVKPLPAR